MPHYARLVFRSILVNSALFNYYKRKFCCTAATAKPIVKPKVAEVFSKTFLQLGELIKADRILNRLKYRPRAEQADQFLCKRNC